MTSLVPLLMAVTTGHCAGMGGEGVASLYATMAQDSGRTAGAYTYEDLRAFPDGYLEAVGQHDLARRLKGSIDLERSVQINKELKVLGMYRADLLEDGVIRSTLCIGWHADPSFIPGERGVACAAAASKQTIHDHASRQDVLHVTGGAAASSARRGKIFMPGLNKKYMPPVVLETHRRLAKEKREAKAEKKKERDQARQGRASIMSMDPKHALQLIRRAHSKNAEVKAVCGVATLLLEDEDEEDAMVEKMEEGELAAEEQEGSKQPKRKQMKKRRGRKLGPRAKRLVMQMLSNLGKAPQGRRYNQDSRSMGIDIMNAGGPAALRPLDLLVLVASTRRVRGHRNQAKVGYRYGGKPGDGAFDKQLDNACRIITGEDPSTGQPVLACCASDGTALTGNLEVRYVWPDKGADGRGLIEIHGFSGPVLVLEGDAQLTLPAEALMVLHNACRDRRVASEMYLHIATAPSRGKLQVPIYAQASASDVAMGETFSMLDKEVTRRGIRVIVRAADHDAKFMKVRLLLCRSDSMQVSVLISQCLAVPASVCVCVSTHRTIFLAALT